VAKGVGLSRNIGNRQLPEIHYLSLLNLPWNSVSREGQKEVRREKKTDALRIGTGSGHISAASLKD